jgi:hypothetical protein
MARVPRLGCGLREGDSPRIDLQPAPRESRGCVNFCSRFLPTPCVETSAPARSPRGCKAEVCGARDFIGGRFPVPHRVGGDTDVDNTTARVHSRGEARPRRDSGWGGIAVDESRLLRSTPSNTVRNSGRKKRFSSCTRSFIRSYAASFPDRRSSPSAPNPSDSLFRKMRRRSLPIISFLLVDYEGDASLRPVRGGTPVCRRPRTRSALGGRATGSLSSRARRRSRSQRARSQRVPSLLMRSPITDVTTARSSQNLRGRPQPADGLVDEVCASTRTLAEKSASLMASSNGSTDLRFSTP